MNTTSSDYKDLISQLNKKQLPKHVAIIMDGNGRWAKKHKLQRINGHKKGVEAVRRTVETAREVGIKFLTVYAFSTENWGRSKIEVSYLLKLIMDSLLKEIEPLIKNGVNIRFIGSKKNLDDKYYAQAQKTCMQSWHNKDLYLNVAMNYGGRIEIIEAFKAIQQDIDDGQISRGSINDALVNNYLYTSGMPDPDIIIRTSGEQRLSNFLVWQAAYSEFWYTDTLWPDFSQAEFVQALLDFQNRDRRYGKRL